MSRYAYTTLLTSDSYLPGALVLASSLRASFTRHPVFVLVPENALSGNALAALEQAYDKIITVPMLRSEDQSNLQLLGRAELDVTYTKLHVFNPEVVLGADKVAFLDADVMVTRNVDAMFDFLKDDIVFGASPDIGWPDCFNSGVFVCTPRKDLFEGLTRAAATTGSFDGGDQGVLNSYFSSWASGVTRPGQPEHRTARMPFTFNVTPTSFYSYLPALVHFQSDISAVHFIGADKPWTKARDGSIDGPMGQYLSRWWNFYDGVKHIFKSGNEGSERATHGSKPASQNESWTGSSSNDAHFPHANNAGAARQDDPDDFSNYRVAWDERESSPLRTGFSASSTPFYRGDGTDATFLDTIQPPSHSVEKFAPVSSESYGWNANEVGQANLLVETPSLSAPGPHGSHWHTANTDLKSTAITTDRPVSARSGGSDHGADDEEEDVDPRVWTENPDEDAFIEQLKSARPRSASKGRPASGGSQHQQQPASSPAAAGVKITSSATARGALGM
ncbi:hypothetical protein HKX48_006300 [Thoreauomyces humboldtii]|nr:hypothetical protein HKX48_006300 [Thoreauomyces humboldtii]